MGDSQKMKQLIKKLTKEEFRIPDEANVIKLRELNIPDYFVDFVIDFEPVRRTFIGNVRLLPIAEIIEQNKDYVPGADVYPLGFTVFASTITGDAFCFHMNANNKLNEHDITLHGAQVTLRPMTENDWDVLLKWNSDPAAHYCSEQCSFALSRMRCSSKVPLYA